jgi:exonuclease SbcC
MISRLTVQSFGCFKTRAVDFTSGLNIVVGPNESGKSTLMRAMEKLLTVPANLTETRFKTEMSRYVALGSDQVAVSARFDDQLGAHFELSRTWGKGHQALLHSEEVTSHDESRIQEFLRNRFGHAESIMKHLLFSHQGEVAAGARRWSEEPNLKQAIDDFFQAQLLQLQGVSPQKFKEKLQRDLQETYRRWDRVNQCPEGGRGIDRPYLREVGAILKAYYELSRAQQERTRAFDFERQMEAIEKQANLLESERQENAAWISRNRKKAELLRERATKAHQLQNLQVSYNKISADYQAWVGTEGDLERIKQEGRDLGERVKVMDLKVLEAENQLKIIQLLDKKKRRNAYEAEVTQLEKRLNSYAKLDPTRIKELRELWQKRRVLLAQVDELGFELEIEAKVEPLQLEVNESGFQGLVPGKSVSCLVEKGLPLRRAFRRGLRLESEKFIVSFALQSQLDSGREAGKFQSLESMAQRESVLIKELGLGDDSGEPEAEQRHSCSAWEEVLEKALQEKQQVFAALAQLKRMGDQTTILTPVEEGLLKDALTVSSASSEELPVLRKEHQLLLIALGEKRREYELLDHRRKQLRVEYQCTEAKDLLARLVEWKVKLDLLQSEVGGDLTDGTELLAEFEQRERRLHEIWEALQPLLEKKSSLLQTAPDQSCEELDVQVQDLKQNYDSIIEYGKRLQTIANAVQRVEQGLLLSKGVPHQGWERSYQRWVRDLFGQDVYVAALGTDFRADPMLQGKTLAIPVDWLSRGAQDLAMLAYRLSFLELWSQPGVANFLWLDDPLVEVDPERRERALQAIASFSKEHQVIYLTCHQETVDEFRRIDPGLNLIRLTA